MEKDRSEPARLQRLRQCARFHRSITKALFGLVVAVVVIHAFIPSAYQYVMPITWLERPWVRWTGVILLLASLVWTVLAQAQMGHSWRIGIDYEHRTPLVRSGIFKFSRNPIFLGMMLTLLGLFLIVPNTLTLLSLVMGVVLIQIQVRLEEEFLAQTHGEEYERYKRVGTED